MAKNKFSREHNRHIKKYCKKWFDRDALIVISDVGGVHPIENRDYYISTLFLHKSFAYKYQYKIRVAQGFNPEISGLNAALDSFILKKTSPDFVRFTNMVLVIDQGKDSFSGVLSRFINHLTESLILLRAKSHVCTIHDVCDKYCHTLKDENTRYEEFGLKEMSPNEFQKKILRPVQFLAPIQ